MRYYSEVIRTMRNGLAIVVSGFRAVVRAVTDAGDAVKRAVTVVAGPGRDGRVPFAAPAARVSYVTEAVGCDQPGAIVGSGGRRRGGGAAVLAVKRTLFGLGAAFFLAACLPSSAEAQYMGCAYCDVSEWGWAYCSYDPDGRLSGCSTPAPNVCTATGGCEEEHAVDLSGIAVNADAEHQGLHDGNGTIRRACDSAITAWRPSRVEATQHRRKLGTLVV